MADQHEHGVGGLEWRDQPGGTPGRPFVPLSGQFDPDDVTATDVFARPGGRTGGTDGSIRAARLDKQARLNEQQARIARQARLDEQARFDEQDDMLDLSALRADDDLLTALCASDLSSADGDRDPELKSLLLAWRLDVDAEPMADLVSTDEAVRTVEAGVRNRRRRPRFLVPLASAAAVLVVVFTGMGLGARDAHPGDALWGLSQVLYADHARSVEAAAMVQTELTHASQALQQGHLNEARTALELAQQSLPSVESSDNQAGLQALQQQLMIKLNDTTTVPAPTPTTADLSTSLVTAPQTTLTQAPPPPPPSTTTTTDPPPPPTTTDPVTTTDPATTTTDSDVPQSDTYSPQQGEYGDTSSAPDTDTTTDGGTS